jgi:tRNA pseudouridine38-40 synthase
LEKTLSRLLQETMKISAAGRTDTGVHASGQVISFTTSRSFPFERLAIAMNSSMPHDVSMRDVAVVPAPFSARFSACERTYVYAILNRPDRSALSAHSAFHVYAPLDLDRMCEAAAAFVGEHDFRSFCATLPEGGVTVREVRALHLERRGEFIRLQITANGFLHRMVRTIVGTLVECGTGRRAPESIAQILAAKARAAAGLTAPPHGLYLAGVKYQDGFDSYAEPPLFR